MIEVDIWVRGTQDAITHRVSTLPDDPSVWNEQDVTQLLSEMLLALNRAKHPESETPSVTLRGFSWIVSPDPAGGVILHLEMQSGTASAGPLVIDEPRLTALITRVMTPVTNTSIH